jgi:phospholipid/cholesterol/gamma-HCH transport system substrate-binding protein
MSREVKTGIIAVLTIALFIWGYNFLKGQNLFEGEFRSFYVEYNNIQGLNESSQVTINGLSVGKVVDINFNNSPEKKGKLIVEILLNNDFEFSKNSVAKIYSMSLLGGQSLAIIPSYEGDEAMSGDYLVGEVESDIFSTVGEKLNPLQAKLENVIVSADSLFQAANEVLNQKTITSIQQSFKNLEYTISDVRQTVVSVNQMLAANKENLNATIVNTKNITDNLSKFSDSLSEVNINDIIKKSELALNTINSLMSQIDNGDGTLGKLIKDEEMYNNLTSATKELEELIQDIKLHPKRYVHFSLFGKKAKSYIPSDNE